MADLANGKPFYRKVVAALAESEERYRTVLAALAASVSMMSPLTLTVPPVRLRVLLSAADIGWCCSKDES